MNSIAAAKVDSAPPEPLEVSVAKRLGDLHQMLYTRGGIRPVNAAVEELSKLLLLRIADRRFKDLVIEGYGPLRDLLSPETIKKDETVDAVKAAFSQVVRLDDLAGKLPDGSSQPVWPLDEPLRITRSDILAEALEVFNHIELSPPGNSTLDPLGTAFDVFLQGKYDHAGGLGTYLTPEPVATLMAQLALSLVDPINTQGGIVFGDPCCGTGRFLVALLEQLRQTRRGDPAVESFASESIFGADQSSSAVAKARVNLLSYGLSHPQVFSVSDSILDPAIDGLTGKLQLILTNPPFGDSKYDSSEGIRRTALVFPVAGKRPKIDPSIAFVARCLTLLQDGGVLGIVLPDGVIDGPALRAALLDGGERPIDFSVEANVSLPTATFSLAGTVAKTSALFLRRGTSDRRTVFLARSEHVGYLKKAGAEAPDPAGNDMPTIGKFAAVLNSSDNRAATNVLCDTPLVAMVLRSDLVSLDPNRLDPGAISARNELEALSGLRLGSLISPVKKRRSQVLNDVPFVSVLHVDDLSNIDWLEAEAYSPTTPGIVAEPGEVIVSLLNPSKMRAAVIPDRYGPVYCSAEFGVFATISSPYGILALLQDPRVRVQLAPLGRGTSSSRRRIIPADVCDLLVPPVDNAWLETQGAKVKRAIDELDRARRALVAAYGTVPV
jgi:methylase of polypeptide subunit release factors